MTVFFRSAFFNLFFFLSTFAMTLWCLTVRTVAPDRLIDAVRAWARLQVWGARRICGIVLVVSGREHLPAHGPALIASVHQSAFDTFVWFTLLPKPAYVLKQELLRIPLFGPMLTYSGMIAIDRDGGARTMRALMRAAADAAKDERQIVIFPEGRRMDPGEHGTVQPGAVAMALHTGLPIIPVRTDSGVLWGRRSFQKRPGPIHIDILPPIPPGLRRADLQDRVTAMLHRGVDKSVA